MHSTKTEHRAASKIALGAVRTAVLFLVAIAAIGQEVSVRTSTRGTYPRVPGAVTKAPAGVGADAPFDVNAFFKAVPREKNAAPLYLDALFEFAADVEVCFPAGPERDRRTQAAPIARSSTPIWSRPSAPIRSSSWTLPPSMPSSNSTT